MIDKNNPVRTAEGLFKIGPRRTVACDAVAKCPDAGQGTICAPFVHRNDPFVRATRVSPLLHGRAAKAGTHGHTPPGSGSA